MPQASDPQLMLSLQLSLNLLERMKREKVYRSSDGLAKNLTNYLLTLVPSEAKSILIMLFGANLPPELRKLFLEMLLNSVRRPTSNPHSKG